MVKVVMRNEEVTPLLGRHSLAPEVLQDELPLKPASIMVTKSPSTRYTSAPRAVTLCTLGATSWLLSNRANLLERMSLTRGTYYVNNPPSRQLANKGAGQAPARALPLMVSLSNP